MYNQSVFANQAPIEFKGKLTVSLIKKQIIMDRTFMKEASNAFSAEYALLQRTRSDYPYFPVVRRKIKKNPKRETYCGLTYAYMEKYIATHENAKENMDIYRELKLISECHSKSRRYPKIRTWFLETYPEIKDFWPKEKAEKRSEMQSDTEEEAENELVMAPLKEATPISVVPATDDVDDAA